MIYCRPTLHVHSFCICAYHCLNSGLLLFSLNKIYYLVIVGLCSKGQQEKGSFTASPKLNKQAFFALSNCHTGKLLSLTCSSKELIFKHWWIQHVTAEATSLAAYRNRRKRKLDPAWNPGCSLDTWWKPFPQKFILMPPKTVWRWGKRYVAWKDSLQLPLAR